MYISDPGGASDALLRRPMLNYGDKQIGTRLNHDHVFRIRGGSVTALSALLKKVHRPGGALQTDPGDELSAQQLKVDLSRACSRV